MGGQAMIALVWLCYGDDHGSHVLWTRCAKNTVKHQPHLVGLHKYKCGFGAVVGYNVVKVSHQ